MSDEAIDEIWDLLEDYQMQLHGNLGDGPEMSYADAVALHEQFTSAFVNLKCEQDANAEAEAKKKTNKEGKKKEGGE